MKFNLKGVLLIVLLSGSASVLADFLTANISNEAKAQILLERFNNYHNFNQQAISLIKSAIEGTKSMKRDELKQQKERFMNEIGQLIAQENADENLAKQAAGQNNIDAFTNAANAAIEKNKKLFEAIINAGVVSAQIQRLEANPS